MADKVTKKATETKIANTHITLNKKIIERDKLLRIYIQHIAQALGREKIIPKSFDNKEIKAEYKALKILENSIQDNIIRNYPTKKEKYDELFKDLGGVPVRYTQTRKQFSSTREDLDFLNVGSELKVPNYEQIVKEDDVEEDVSDKADISLRGNSHKLLKSLIHDRNILQRKYIGHVAQALGREKDIPKDYDITEIKSEYSELKNLENQIQQNINKYYTTNKEKYDKVFKDIGGVPMSFTQEKLDYSKNRDNLDYLNVGKNFIIPEEKELFGKREDDPTEIEIDAAGKSLRGEYKNKKDYQKAMMMTISAKNNINDMSIFLKEIYPKKYITFFQKANLNVSKISTTLSEDEQDRLYHYYFNEELENFKKSSSEEYDRMQAEFALTRDHDDVKVLQNKALSESKTIEGHEKNIDEQMTDIKTNDISRYDEILKLTFKKIHENYPNIYLSSDVQNNLIRKYFRIYTNKIPSTIKEEEVKEVKEVKEEEVKEVKEEVIEEVKEEVKGDLQDHIKNKEKTEADTMQEEIDKKNDEKILLQSKAKNESDLVLGHAQRIDTFSNNIRTNSEDKYNEYTKLAEQQINNNYPNINLPSVVRENLLRKYFQFYAVRDGGGVEGSGDLSDNPHIKDKTKNETDEEKKKDPPMATPFQEVATTKKITIADTPSSVTSGTSYAGPEGEMIRDISSAERGPIDDTVYDFKSKLLGKLEPQSEAAALLSEDKIRSRKSVDFLKTEILCMHTVYTDLIPEIMNNFDRVKKWEAAIKSNDIKRIISYHKELSDIIRTYFKTADLRIGVIMSAESLFGHSVSNMISGHLESGASGLPNMVQHVGQQFIKKGTDKYAKAVAGDVTVRRGGRTTKKPVMRNVPKYNAGPENDMIPEIVPVVDAPKAYVFRTGIRARQQFRNPELKLKTLKK